ncbi:MAG: hypothetical protein IJ269_00825, partial [Bacteroidales bacterium]|nr:hypothetical protein [Bacteroidales bacterium]
MKRIHTIFATILLAASTSFGQIKKCHNIVYQSYRHGVAEQDTSYTIVKQQGNQISIADSGQLISQPIPGLARAVTYVDYDSMVAFSQLTYPDAESYYAKSAIGSKHITYTNEGSETVLGFECTKFSTSINSNRIEIWMTNALGCNATPMPQFANLDGVMVKYVRNGSSVMEIKKVNTLAKAKRIHPSMVIIPKNLGTEKTLRELDNIRRNKMIITYKVFDNDRVHWGADTKWNTDMPLDSVIHFAGGTLILKQINIDKLPQHYQVFAELHTHSEGDAYDRTGSIFVIPTDFEWSFYDALTKGISVVPGFKSKTGEEYRGMTIDNNYLPAMELVRFFTPFGVKHFNDRVQIDGLEWATEAYYKQEITDIFPSMSGPVLIGAFIGNYDGGGHKVSLDIKAYPGS